MAIHMPHRWPRSAGVAGDRMPDSPRGNHSGVHGRPQPSHTTSEHDDPRLHFATKFWGRRRYSDSASQLPQHPLTSQSLQDVDRQTSSSHGRYPPLDDPELPRTPTSSRSVQFPNRSSPSPQQYQQQRQRQQQQQQQEQQQQYEQERSRHHHQRHHSVTSAPHSSSLRYSPAPSPTTKTRTPQPHLLSLHHPLSPHHQHHHQPTLNSPRRNQTLPHPIQPIPFPFPTTTTTTTTTTPTNPTHPTHPTTTPSAPPLPPTPAQPAPFLHIPGYTPHPIHPRNPSALPTRRDELADALSKIDARAGPVTLQGVGGLARPVLGVRRSNTAGAVGVGEVGGGGAGGVGGGGLGWWLDFAGRSLLLPKGSTGAGGNGMEGVLGGGLGGGLGSGGSVPVVVAGLGTVVEGVGVVATPVQVQGAFQVGSGGGGVSPYGSRHCDECVPPPQSPVVVVPLATVGGTTPDVDARELRRLESELFDTAKYVGGSDGRCLTVMTWSEDSAFGTITLFEVDVERPASPLSTRSTGLAARRRHAPMALYPDRERGRVASVKPVAAMEDVPRQVLVSMRVDQGVKKTVLHHDRETGRFRWKAHHTRRGQPNFARVWGMEELHEVHTATATVFDDDDHSGTTRRSRRRDAGRRERSSLRAEHARDITARHRETRDELPVIRDKDGIVATIPQILALFHANRSIIEKASSKPPTDQLVETEDGERVRVVSLTSEPKGMRHRGRDVHVAVLVPDGAKWVGERIFWTDEQGGLAELRKKTYRHVIDSGRPITTRRGTRAYDRDLEMDILSPGTLPPHPQSARW